MTSPNMSCPSGASFYACGEGSKFVGCCASNPCGSTGCAAGSLVSTSFDADQYDELPDQQCSAGLFYKCAATDAPFWGCCSSNPCAGSGCAQSDLAGAFLSGNQALAEPYLSLNTTWTQSSVDTTSANDTSPATPSPTPSGTQDSESSNVGAIAGGVVGGVVVLVAIVAGIWFLRRRKTKAAARYSATVQRPPPELQEMYPHMDENMAKEGPYSYNSSPAISSNPRSPGFPPNSPRPPSYWSEAQTRHISYELPAMVAVEMEDNSVPANTSPRMKP